ncbi:ABC transporter ATP-binding protein [Reichenbachiella versicolor]|uniref:ABC transporter ATP-binding protein n=1 Tax=Reichenbachiella versicolor TaxID=1821036 RepID=UPI000D6E7C41|nr:ABC transporter ATP-binding protein [Reichenbachiella versicolor]
MLQAYNIHKSYSDLNVLKGIDLSVSKNEVISIVGASGAGKSTLLQILGTLDKPDIGDITINNQSINGMKPNQLAAFRNKQIGFVFQFHNLLPEFSLEENILIPSYIGGNSGKKVSDYADQLMRMLGVYDRRTHKPSQLSGGEQQRAAVARALINKPSIIFADEPSGNLDSVNANHLHSIFFELQKQLGQTFVIVTHNKELADMTDRKIVMADGKISE